MIKVGATNAGFVKYLIGQLMQSDSDRVQTLREFAPGAADSDWELKVAGQRVQVIRRAKGKGGVLDFGTIVLSAADGTIAGLLGASPGASTAVPAMLDVMERCFSDRYASWLPKLKEMVPPLGTALSSEPALFEEVWSWGTRVLKLNERVEVAAE
jgi:malate dehydrogenase (quinone)